MLRRGKYVEENSKEWFAEVAGNLERTIWIIEKIVTEERVLTRYGLRYWRGGRAVEGSSLKS